MNLFGADLGYIGLNSGIPWENYIEYLVFGIKAFIGSGIISGSLRNQGWFRVRELGLNIAMESGLVRKKKKYR